MVVEVEISPFQNHEIYVLVNEKWDGAFAVELWSRWQLFLGLICYFYFATIINAFTALQMCHLGSKPTSPILEEARFLPTRSPSLLRSPRNTSPGVKSSDETAGNNHTAKKHAVLSKI